MEETQRAAVRHFNRSVTQRVGALNDSFLSRGRPLGHSRVLWEIGPDGAELRELRDRLDLDSGYLSRILRALEVEGLVTVDANPDDRRVRQLRLTPAGRSERDALDRLSDAQAESMLAPLADHHREQLVSAMATIERLLTASAIEIGLADPSEPAVRSAMSFYFAELARRFDGGFEVGTTLPTQDEQLRLPAGLVLLARAQGEPVGCVAVKLHADGTGEIKRLWVATTARGMGLARRLLAAIEHEAATRGCWRVQLDTNRALVEAIALYRASGYREIAAFNDEPYAHHWFEKRIP